LRRAPEHRRYRHPLLGLPAIGQRRSRQLHDAPMPILIPHMTGDPARGAPPSPLRLKPTLSASRSRRSRRVLHAWARRLALEASTSRIIGVRRRVRIAGSNSLTDAAASPRSLVGSFGGGILAGSASTAGVARTRSRTASTTSTPVAASPTAALSDGQANLSECQRGRQCQRSYLKCHHCSPCYRCLPW
jgi:hypothetical protein